MMITVFIRVLVELACMFCAITVAPVLYLAGNSSGALSAFLICYGIGRMVAATPEERAALHEFQKQRLNNVQ